MKRTPSRFPGWLMAAIVGTVGWPFTTALAAAPAIEQR